jgi:site-specific recombinase XerD
VPYLEKRGKIWHIRYRKNSRWTRISCRTHKKSIATRKLAEFIAGGGENRQDIETHESVTFSGFAEEYRNYIRTHKSRRWAESQEMYLHTHMIPFFGDMALAEVSTKRVEEYVEERSKQVKNVTVNKELACLKHLFRIAEERGYVAVNPAKKVKMLPYDGTVKDRWLNERECKNLIEKANDYVRPFIEVALYTGMRKSELLNLEWADIDMEGKVVKVKNKEEHHTKTYEERYIPISNRLYGLLKTLPRHDSSDYVFHNDDGSKWIDVRGSFYSAIEKAGLECSGRNKITLHTLRHTFASHLVMNGVHLRTVQKLLGHKSIKTTERYAHLAPDYMRDAVERLYKWD